MRLWRGILASVAGLAAGFVAALVAASSLRAATPDADLVWNAVPPGRVTTWVLALAHGVPVRIRTTAGISAQDAPGSVGRLGELLGGRGGASELAFTFSVLLIPVGLLLVVGVIVALLARRADARSPRELLALTGVTAATHGGLLALAAWWGGVDIALRGRLAPELGFGAATGRLGFLLGPSPIAALLIGTVWGAAFAVAGAMSSPTLRAYLSGEARVVLRGWLRGFGAAIGLVAGGLALGGVVALAGGRAPGFGLIALGAYSLWANAVSAGIVLAHGGSVAVALDAGPFSGWERVDLLHYGVAAAPAPWVWWLGSLVPLVAGVVAGRYAARRSSLSPAAIGLRFGALWGLTLAVLSLLLRVRALSSFSLGDLRLGGGSAVIDPLASLVLGAVWGSVTGTLGAFSLRGGALVGRRGPERADARSPQPPA